MRFFKRLQDGEAAIREAGPAINVLARIGYAAKGVVYLMIGTTGFVGAIRRSGQAEDFDGVLLNIFQRPLGSVLLALLTVGLIGYSLWCLIQGVLDTEHKGVGFLGIVTRVSYAVVGVIYAAVARSALRLQMGTGALDPGDRPQQEWTASVFRSVPFGGWFVALIGIGFLVFCLFELRRAIGNKFQILRPEGDKEIEDKVGTFIGRVGLTARALVFAIIGFFLVLAGIDFDPQKVHGISGALDVLLQQTYGPWLLAIIAAGLVFYGGYMFFLAWRRRIDLL